MNTRPPAMAGCDRATVTSPRLNAHFSLSLGTSEAASPAEAASWNRELVRLVLQPFHCGEFAAGRKAGVAFAGRGQRRERPRCVPPVGAM